MRVAGPARNYVAYRCIVRAKIAIPPAILTMIRMLWSFFPAREFERLAPEWDRLALACGDVPFLHSRFIAPLLAEFAGERSLLASCADQRGVVAMTIVAPKGGTAWQTWQPSQLPLCPWVMRRGDDVGALGESLLRALPGFALHLGLTQLDPHLVSRPTAGACIETLDYIETGWIAIEGAFDDYWSARGKNLRTNMRKQRKKLQTDGVAPALELCSRREDMAAAVADYGTLESAGWKASLGTAIHPDNAQGRFYRSMLENFAAVGSACVYRYRFGEKVVAVDLCVRTPAMLVVLKTTYDESIRTLSPAFLLREDALRTIFGDAQGSRVEFYGKMMDWHTHWTRQVRTLYHVNCYRWRWVGRLRALLARTRTPASQPEREPSATDAPNGSKPPVAPARASVG